MSEVVTALSEMNSVLERVRNVDWSLLRSWCDVMN